jgi:hypothetical protein
MGWRGRMGGKREGMDIMEPQLTDGEAQSKQKMMVQETFRKIYLDLVTGCFHLVQNVFVCRILFHLRESCYAFLGNRDTRIHSNIYCHSCNVKILNFAVVPLLVCNVDKYYAAVGSTLFIPSFSTHQNIVLFVAFREA